MGKPSYKELEIRIRELEKLLTDSRDKPDYQEKLLQLKEQNVELIRKSIVLSEVRKELEDKNYELKSIQQKQKDENINLIRKSIELSNLTTELEDKNYELDKQNYYNKLISDVWKLGVDKSSSEETIVQNLFEIIGPAFDVCSVEYLKMNKETQEFLTVDSWCRQKPDKPRKSVLPSNIADHFLSKRFLYLPDEMDSNIEPFFAGRFEQFKIKSLLLVPFGTTENKPDKLLAFFNYRNKRRWRTLEKVVISNMANIVAIRMDQILAERILLESEEKFKTLTEQSFAGITLSDFDGNYVYVNKAFCKMSGYTEEELLSLSVNEMKPDIYQHQGVFQDIKERTSSKPTRTHYQKKDKTEYTAEVIGKAITIDNKKLFLSTIRDITKQVERENEINKLLTIVEQSANTIVITDTDGNIEFANPKFTEITGYTLQEVKGKHTRLLGARTKPKRIYDDLWDAITNKKIWQGEFHNIRKNGELYWEYATITPILDMTGEITNYLAIKEDITAKKAAEENARMEQERFRKIMDISPSGIYIINKEYDIDYINPVIEKEFGKVNGQKCYQYFNDFNEECEWCKNKEVFEGKSVRWEWESKKNNKFYDVFDTPLMNLDGSMSKFVITYDITKRKEYESSLKDINDKKDKLFSIIAHDLRSPFNSLLGLSDLLLVSNKDDDKVKSEEYIKLINDISHRTLELLGNLLAWASSQSGLGKFSQQEVDIISLVNEVFNTTHPSAINKEIEIVNNIKTITTVYADRNMIKTVVRNIINNAIKFTKKGGSVKISAKKLIEKKKLEISITDTGIGIPKEKQKDLFRIDKNISTRGTDNEVGTGLGLILCKEFVEKNNGEIKLESKAGKGTKISFTLPLFSQSN
ncbi:MAG: PAS domain-containing sensor histidine kinase [Bacteroidota bacterium]